MIAKRLSLLSPLLLAAAASAANTWYVDVNAVPPGTGTLADPFTSIQQAIDSPTVLDGDTVLVAPGVYAEAVKFNDFKRTAVRSQSGPLVTRIEPVAPVPPFFAIVDLGNHAFSSLNGFTVSGANAAKSVGVVGANSIVRNCVITGNKIDPAFPSGFRGNGLVSNFDLWVENCTVTGNARGASTAHINAIYFTNTIVQGNTEFDFGPAFNGTYHHTLSGTSVLPGTGNLTGSPGFWGASDGDYRLNPLSQCVDAGDPTSPLAIVYDATYAPGPVTFCTAKINSQGCAPTIGFTGRATSNGAEPFVVTATNEIPGKAGLLFYGPGKHFVPFQAGFHCVNFPTKRVGVQGASGGGPCGGTYTFDFGAYLAAGPHPLTFAGATLACQWWSRDTLDPSGFGTGLSNALYFGVAP
jgi:hypothetical protein